MKMALIIANIGTPQSPEPQEVGHYLNEFLMDPEVISIPYLLRVILVKGLIVPRRKYRSAHAYQQIWTAQGSPLAVHMRDLAIKLQENLSQWRVDWAMRYGQPSIKEVLARYRDFDTVRVVPLFPQWARATSSSIEGESRRAWHELGGHGQLEFTAEFHQRPEYIEALVSSAKEFITPKWDHLLLSFHGLPEEHIRREDATKSYCLKSDSCCVVFSPANQKCYRAQCFATARAVAGKLGITNYTVSFQSRLGRAQWIRPYTNDVLSRLAKSGVKRVLVMSPAFVMDCLETLEEISLGAKQHFIAEGGDDLALIPCLNERKDWVQGLAEIVGGI